MKLIKNKSQKGFTLVEVLLVLVLAAILFTIIAINLFRLQSRSQVGSTTDTLVSDINLQQSKAMLGATEGRATADSYGIYFLTDSYVLFHGNTYNASDTSNFIVDFSENQEIEGTTFPSNIVVFSALSGEIVGFTPGSNTITLKTSNTNDETTITLNRYGVITQVQ